MKIQLRLISKSVGVGFTSIVGKIIKNTIGGLGMLLGEMMVEVKK